MNFGKKAIAKELIFLVALVGAITVSILMYRPKSSYLLINLGLALVPYILSLIVLTKKRHYTLGGFEFFVFFVLWLIFYPNAIYMLTDLIHINFKVFYDFDPSALGGIVYKGGISQWIYFGVTVASAIMASALSYMSFRRMADAFTRFTAVKIILLVVLSYITGVSVFIGRFLRFNSWDLIFMPGHVIGFISDNFNNNSLIIIGIFTAVHFVVIGALSLVANMFQPEQFPEPDPIPEEELPLEDEAPRKKRKKKRKKVENVESVSEPVVEPAPVTKDSDPYSYPSEFDMQSTTQLKDFFNKED